MLGAVCLRLFPLFLALSPQAAASQSETFDICPSGCSYTSIQQAINGAASGATLRIGPGTYNETLTLRSGVSLMGAGPGVTVVHGAGNQPTVTASGAGIGRTTVIEQLSITGGGGQNGAGVLVRNGAAPTLRSLVIDGNTASSWGGGVGVINGGDALLEGVVIRNNASPGGSGMALTSQSRATVRDSTFENNSATGARTAGALYVIGSSQLFMQDSVVRGSSAVNGGGMRISSGSTVQITGGRFENNSASNLGGGLSVHGSTLNLDGVTVIDNSATLGGALGAGAFSGSLSTVSVLNSTFQGNRTQQSGGGILVKENTEIVVNGCHFIDNISLQWSGGAIASDQNPLEVRNSIFDGNRALFGGAIHLHYSPDALLQNSVIVNGHARDGAGVYVTGGRVRLDGNTLSHNVVTEYGGAVVIQEGADAEVRFNHILHNTAGWDGGGVVFQSGATGWLTGNTISFNQAMLAGGAMTIWNQTAPILANNRFEGNQASDGAAIQIEEFVSPFLINNEFIGNAATRYGGALVVNIRATPTIRSNLFSGNQAALSGGAIIINDQSRALVEKNTIVGNTAGTGGGVVVLADDHSQIEDNYISGNVAAHHGGGIYLSLSNAYVTGNQILDNQAGGLGGGVVTKDGAPAIVNNLISGNHASDRGAGLYIENAQSTVRHNTIAHNGRNQNGEGVMLAAGAHPNLIYNVIVGNDYGIRSEGSQPNHTYRNNLFDNRLADYHGVTPGVTDLLVDPQFVNGPLGQYYLSQTAAGQVTTSPLVDACTETAHALGLDHLTTRTDDQPDLGLADIGFHYRPSQMGAHQVFLPTVRRMR